MNPCCFDGSIPFLNSSSLAILKFSATLISSMLSSRSYPPGPTNNFLKQGSRLIYRGSFILVMPFWLRRWITNILTVPINNITEMSIAIIAIGCNPRSCSYENVNSSLLFSRGSMTRAIKNTLVVLKFRELIINILPSPTTSCIYSNLMTLALVSSKITSSVLKLARGL